MINFLKKIFIPLPKEHRGPYKPNNVPPMQEGQYIKPIKKDNGRAS